MDIFPWRGRLAIVFLLLALILNTVHYTVFNDSDYIFKFILAQLGFLPISVYLVTVVINQLLKRREKEVMLKKLNMVIGSFFSEVGTELLRCVSSGPEKTAKTQKYLNINIEWKNKDYTNAHARLKEFDSKLNHTVIDWENLREFLIKGRPFLLGLLGNSNLLEHETFTELLWAVFHLSEELSNRRNVSSLSENDYEHLLGDVKRAYVLLVSEWLNYMQHLQGKYPFLFSLAVRTNPFASENKVEIA